MRKYKYQKVLKVGKSLLYDKEYSRLYIKLPESWCKGNEITKGHYIRITETVDRLVIEKEDEE
jgi:hypothetical protein